MDNDSDYEDTTDIEDEEIYSQDRSLKFVLNSSNFAIAKANVFLKRAQQLSDVYFNAQISEWMRRHNYRQVLRLQSYAWPHLIKATDHGAVIIASPMSGRTFSYLLPLCHIVTNMMEEKLKHVSNGKSFNVQGPVALVMVPDIQCVELLAARCHSIIRRSKNAEFFKTVTTLKYSCTYQLFWDLLGGSGCLITTPAQMIWLFKNGGASIKFPNLKFVALDDVDLMEQESLMKAFKLLKQEINRSCAIRPQLVATTQSFVGGFLPQILEYNQHSMILFGDILEAVIYDGAKFSLSLVQQKAKLQHIENILKQRSPFSYRTIIYCQMYREIIFVAKELEKLGYSTIPYTVDVSWTLREKVELWQKNNDGKIILISDDCPEVYCCNVDTIIHYSLGTTWSKFQLRHLNFKQKVEMQQPENLKALASNKVFVFVDEHNEEQLPRLVDFLLRHNCPVDSIVIDLAQRIRAEMQSIKMKGVSLCPYIMSHAHCKASHCEFRHFINDDDRLSAKGAPVSGDIKIRILKVYSPVHFAVQLTDYLPQDTKTWKSFHDKGSNIMLILGLQSYFLRHENCVPIWPPILNDVCVCKSEHSYERVRIIKVPYIESLNEPNLSLRISVKAMDINTREFSISCGDLFACPAEYRNEPPLAIDVRVIGVVPASGERTFSTEDVKLCKELQTDLNDDFWQANIVFSLSHTIFVKNIVRIKYAKKLKTHVSRWNLRLNLTQYLKCAKACLQTQNNVLQFFNEHIKKPYKQEPAQKAEKSEEKLAKKVDGKVTANDLENINKIGPKQRFLAAASQIYGKNFTSINKQMNEAFQTSETLEAGHGPVSELKIKYEGLNDIEHFEAYSEGNTKSSEDLDFKTQESALVDQELLNETDFGASWLKEAASQNELEFAMKFFETAFIQTPENEKDAQNSDQKDWHGCSKDDQNFNNSGSAVEASSCANVIDPVKTTTASKQYLRPTGSVHPEVKYYQTNSTIELQVLLPEDSIEYSAVLCDCKHAFVFETSNYEPMQYFCLSAYFSFTHATHHMQGRTVYISVVKLLKMECPLLFSHNRNMKSNFESRYVLKNDKNKRERLANATHVWRANMWNFTDVPNNLDDYDTEDDDDATYDDTVETLPKYSFEMT